MRKKGLGMMAEKFAHLSNRNRILWGGRLAVRLHSVPHFDIKADLLLGYIALEVFVVVNYHCWACPSSIFHIWPHRNVIGTFLLRFLLHFCHQFERSSQTPCNFLVTLQTPFPHATATDDYFTKVSKYFFRCPPSPQTLNLMMNLNVFLEIT